MDSQGRSHYFFRGTHNSANRFAHRPRRRRGQQKTSLAIKMNARFFFNFFAFISLNWQILVNFPTESKGRTTPKFGLCPCVYALQTTSKRKFRVVFPKGCKEKRTGRAKFVVFHLLIGLIAIAFVVAPRVYRWEYTVRNPNTFSVKTPVIFSLDIYVIQDSVH